MPFGQLSDRGLAVVRRAAELARRSGGVNPAHLLAAVLEVSGPLGEMAAVAHAPVPRKARSDDEPAPESLVHYDRLSRQAIESAGAWALRRGTKAGPEDLFIALVDQHSPPVVAALARMGHESERLRPAALRMLGLPDHYGPVPLEPLQAAGISERSLLEIEDLPADVWADLEARQARLPVRRVRRRSDWAAVVINEQRAVRKVAARRNATDHECNALIHHHLRAVERRGAEAVPGVVREPEPQSGEVGRIANRRMALKVAWFRWTAQRY
ncbi:MAG TPA: hypothetical protein VFH58_04190 [Acidimicrobiales bacterium]|nr:hypothetical protein [Acidimicrobiales bacterium]